MRKVSLAALFVSSLLLIGCSGLSQQINSISIGMTKREVIEAMGAPVSSSAQNGVEYLNYLLYEDVWTQTHGTHYFVRLIGGKVESYGRTGDFNSTKNPTVDINVRQR